MTSPLPDVNAPVTLRLAGEDVSYAVQLKDVEDDELVVTAPKLTGGVFTVRDEAVLELEWAGERGLLTVPVRRIGYQREDRSLWRLETCGPISRSQRRRYVRAPLSLPCWLHVSTASRAGVPDLNTGTSVEGTLLDLSEAGVRLVLPHGGRHVRALGTGHKVIVEMTLLEETLLLPGEVLSAMPVVPPGGESLCVVVILDDPGPVAALLRKVVLSYRSTPERPGHEAQRIGLLVDHVLVGLRADALSRVGQRHPEQ